MAEDDHRPSFATIWKKGKQKLRGSREEASPDRQLPNSSESGDGAEQSKTKHEARRAQIRSAQIRHRQRKAHYQKELECDVNKYRTLITHAEAETSLLRQENDAIRAALLEAGIALPDRGRSLQHLSAEDQASQGLQSMQIDPYTSPSTGLESQSAQSSTPEMFSNIDINDLTVTLQVDEIMGTPVFNISSNSSNSGYYSEPSPSQTGGSEVVLSRVQEQAAINFILALEHVCWDHFSTGTTATHLCSGVIAGHDENEGHTLMASAYCMADAPSTLYDNRQALTSPSPSASSSSTSLHWHTSGITLQSLRGLAESLNPGDKELTPVQAWFELAERYPPEVLLEGGILEALKREFKGVVRCIMFGAAMEREAFESVVARVIGEFAPST